MLKEFFGRSDMDWQTFAEPPRVMIVEECRVERPEVRDSLHAVRIELLESVDVLVNQQSHEVLKEQRIPQPPKKGGQPWGFRRKLNRNNKFDGRGNRKYC